jgi:hypothetical protein
MPPQSTPFTEVRTAGMPFGVHALACLVRENRLKPGHRTFGVPPSGGQHTALPPEGWTPSSPHAKAWTPNRFGGHPSACPTRSD